MTDVGRRRLCTPSANRYDPATCGHQLAPLTLNSTVNSKLDVADDTDWYKVTVKAGLTYSFTIQGDGFIRVFE